MRFRIRYVPFLLIAGAVAALVFTVMHALARGRYIPQCPSCHSNRLRPSWPTVLDRFVLLHCQIRPWRCEACRYRFYLRR
jgi:hypothetical protein